MASSLLAGAAQVGADSAVKPGDDFYRYAAGQWLAATTIPADHSQWGSFDQLESDTQSQVRKIVESLGGAAGSERKIAQFYRAYLDTDAIERAGLAPALPGLASIAAARSHADLAALMGKPELRLPSPIDMAIRVDEKNPARYIVTVTQGGLGMPDREHYLNEGQAFVELRDKYRRHIARVLALANENDAEAQAREILALETRIADQHWPTAKRFERELTYNPRTRQELEALAPEYPWSEWLRLAGLQDRNEFVVAELDAVAGLGRLFAKTPPAIWQSYLKFHYLDVHADVLPKAFDEERFDFFGRTLNGQLQQRERSKRAVDAVNRALGEAVGKLYVEQYFRAETKQRAVEMVAYLRRAFAQRIERAAWMSQKSRESALEKLRAITPKIGYPDKWRDYSALEVRSGDAFGNVVRAETVEHWRQVGKLGRPADRDEWAMLPQTVNAYYNPRFNEIVLPAAIMQPPFFDPDADPAVNFGALGGVAGHELAHGFDDQGAKSDGRGVLRTWWAVADEQAFKGLGDALVAQYNRFQPLPGLYINGRLTLGENIADLAGLEVAHEAYRLFLRDQDPAQLTRTGGDRRFFLAQAQVWRTSIRDQALREQVLRNSHGPAEFRVNGVVRNMDAWYAAFGVKPGDGLYLPPEQRIRIW